MEKVYKSSPKGFMYKGLVLKVGYNEGGLFG